MVVTDGDVLSGCQYSIHPPPDEMRSVGLTPASARCICNTHPEPTFTAWTASSPSVFRANAPYNRHDLHQHRQHYRLGAVEVGVPISGLTDHKSMIIAVRGALAGELKPIFPGIVLIT